MAKSNEYMNRYMKERYETRRSVAVRFLGGKCIACGSVDNLQFDHIDPSTKEFTIARGSSVSEERWWKEIKKCQLLCDDCHKKKTFKNSKVNVHGTLSCYRHSDCRCDKCKSAVSEHNKLYRQRKRAGSLVVRTTDF